MGRKNLILGNAAGKLGDVVFYRDGGEQRFRTRVTPANPQSMSQQSQRSRLGGVTNTFRAAKGILADSFETKAVNQSAFNAFAASALSKAPYLSKTAVAGGGAWPMPMALSKGSLPQPFVIDRDADDEGYDVTMPGIAFGAATGNTIGTFSKALIDWKPCVFRNGSVIVFVVIEYLVDTTLDEEYLKPQLSVVKFVLDSASTVALPASFGIFDLTWNTTTAKFNAEDPVNEACIGIFVVNDDADGLHVSSCDAVLSTLAANAYGAAITEEARIAAAESYGGSKTRCVL